MKESNKWRTLIGDIAYRAGYQVFATVCREKDTEGSDYAARAKPLDRVTHS